MKSRYPRTLAEAYGTGSLAPCGCGGEARPKELAAGWHICCKSCGISTANRPTIGQAEAAWNRAMSKSGGERHDKTH